MTFVLIYFKIKITEKLHYETSAKYAAFLHFFKVTRF